MVNSSAVAHTASQPGTSGDRRIASERSDEENEPEANASTIEYRSIGDVKFKVLSLSLFSDAMAEPAYRAVRGDDAFRANSAAFPSRSAYRRIEQKKWLALQWLPSTPFSGLRRLEEALLKCNISV